ncbi:unnamed protein product [Chilo suppressalis]|uniref:Attacin C-terminal domain-containing protein n=1 Tax=Chilo suppressalis TaxID=168631 RepID=A0ABN8B6K6_CHISP|nr:unnamed protein product [Chilo suppressalis]
MKFLVAFSAVLVVAMAQQYEHPYDIIYNNFDELPESYVDPEQGLRFRRDITFDRNIDNGRVFGTLGSTDDGLFGRAGVERHIFNDARGRLDAQAHGTRTLGPAGGTSALGGSLNWRNDNANAALDVSKQIGGSTSVQDVHRRSAAAQIFYFSFVNKRDVIRHLVPRWSAAGGGRWPIGKNGDFGVDGTFSRINGLKDYGARGVFNYRF